MAPNFNNYTMPGMDMDISLYSDRSNIKYVLEKILAISNLEETLPTISKDMYHTRDDDCIRILLGRYDNGDNEITVSFPCGEKQAVVIAMSFYVDGVIVKCVPFYVSGHDCDKCRNDPNTLVIPEQNAYILFNYICDTIEYLYSINWINDDKRFISNDTLVKSENTKTPTSLVSKPAMYGIFTNITNGTTH